MSIENVMAQAVKTFEPLAIYADPAIRKAIEVGEAYCVEHSQTVNRAKLREAAEEVWSLYMGVMNSKLLPKAIRELLPPLYSQENERDPVVQVKFFTPDSSWTWYATEFDGLNTFFGLVIGLDTELGYFLLSELEEARGPMGLPIERDLYFKPKKLSEVRREHEERGELRGLGMIVLGTAYDTSELYDPDTEVNPDPTPENPFPIAVNYLTGHYFLRQWDGHDWQGAENNSELEEEVRAYVTARFESGESGSWFPISKAIATKARFPRKGDLAEVDEATA